MPVARSATLSRGGAGDGRTAASERSERARTAPSVRPPRGWGFGVVRVDLGFISGRIQPRGWGFGGVRDDRWDKNGQIDRTARRRNVPVTNDRGLGSVAMLNR